MKRTNFLISTLLACFFVANTYAQIKVGAKVGPAFTDVSTKGINLDIDLLDPMMKTGITAGVFLEAPIGHQGFYFSPEFNYIEKGFRIQQNINPKIGNLEIPLGAEATFRFGYLEMPLLLAYHSQAGPIRVHMRAGPVFGYALDGTMTTRVRSIVDIKIAETNLHTDGRLYNPMEVGAMAGAGLSFDTGAGMIRVDANYHQGFSDVLDEPVIDMRVRNRAVSLTLGYAFRF